MDIEQKTDECGYKLSELNNGENIVIDPLNVLKAQFNNLYTDKEILKKYIKERKLEGKEIENFVKNNVLPKMAKQKKIKKHLGFKFYLKNIKHVFPFLVSKQKIPFDWYVIRQNKRIKRMLEILKSAEHFDKINKPFILYTNKEFMKWVKYDNMDEEEKDRLIKWEKWDNNSFNNLQ